MAYIIYRITGLKDRDSLLMVFFSISEKDLQIKKKKTHGSIDLPENSGIWSRWLS